MAAREAACSGTSETREGEGERGNAAGSNGGGSGKKKSSGRTRRRERRLRNEPQNVSGDLTPLAINVLDFAEARATELRAMADTLTKKPGEGGKRVFQQLPRHMRRRAMSHNIRRLPRRLQERASKEMEKQTCDGDQKKKSRKMRRKVRNLRRERIKGRSQREGDSAHKPAWLETHIWHAKRMRMVDHHGYRVAESVNDKGVRQAYRSMKYGCLISDVSYECCIEVTGPRRDILSSLSPCFNCDTGATLAGIAYKDGSRAGHCIMYHSDRYPYGAIGPVKFLWQPVNDDVVSTTDSTIKLWLTVSPAIYDEVMNELTVAMATFDPGCRGDRPKNNNGESSVVDSGESRSSKVTVTSLRDEFVRFRLIGPRSHTIVMETLKPITADPMTSDPGEPHLISRPDLSRIPIPVPWWNGNWTLAAHTELLSNNLGALRNASNLEVFPRGAVIGMVVGDPRVCVRAKKKSGVVCGWYPGRRVDWWGCEGGDECEGEGEGEGGGEEGRCEGELCDMEVSCEGVMGGGDKGGVKKSSNDVITGHTETESDTSHKKDTQTPNDVIDSKNDVADPNFPLKDLADSPLWCASIRKIVSESKAPDHILNEVRSQTLVGSSEVCLGERSPRIPVMLVRREYASSHVDGVLQLESGCRGYRPLSTKSVATSNVGGWDLLLPSNWGMPFWISLIYGGARACGRRGLNKVRLECGVSSFPEDYPDTSAGVSVSGVREREREREYCRRPPDKRKNFGKLTIWSPFSSAWGEVVRGWRGKVGSLVTREVGGAVGVVCEPPAKRPRVADDDGDGDIITGQSLTGKDSKFDTKFYVLRSKSSLLSISRFLHRIRLTKSASHSGTASGLHQESIRLVRPESHSGTESGPNQTQQATAANASFQNLVRECGIDRILEEHSNSLVGVVFEMLHRGNANSNDIISVPTLLDLQKLTDSREKNYGPEEPPCARGVTVAEGDVVCVGVSGLTSEEREGAKRERGRRARERAKLDEEGVDISREAALSSICHDYKLSHTAQSRQTVGYTTTCGHRLSSSRDGGFGLCSLLGLIEAGRVCHEFKVMQGGREGVRVGGREGVRVGDVGIVVLIRGQSLHYRFARFDLSFS